MGGLTLEEDGRPLTGRAAQKRRLGLLALLAASPGRSASRDRLMGLLWPDKDAEQARHLLSVAAYDIRKELGEDVLQSRGDDLALDPLFIGSDVSDLQGAAEVDDFDAIIALYRGAFLDGFYAGRSAPFEHWVDELREELARDYRRALEAVAERREREGDLAGAVEVWRRLANHDRFDGRIATRLVEALTAAGNRAGALQFARVHEALVREEFEADPDPAFTAAVEAAREDGLEVGTVDGRTPANRVPAAAMVGPPLDPPSNPPPSPHALRQPRGSARGARSAAVALLIILASFGGYWVMLAEPAPADDVVGVAVLPFTSPDSANAAFAAGLSEAIMDVLGEVEGLRVPAWSASLALAGVPAGQAAQRLGVGHVVTGTVRRGQDRLRIRAELSNTAGDLVWSESYDRPADELFETWDEIALEVLDAVAPELQAASASRLVGFSGDPKAYELYVKGRHAWLTRTPEALGAALLYFRAALEHDPRDARTLAGVADVYNVLGAYDYGGLPPDSAYPKALAAAERALEIAPRLAGAHAALANARFAYLRDWEGAEASFRRAIELNPRYAEAYHWYSLFLVAMGREKESMEAAERALALDSLSPVMRSSHARHLYFRGDYEGSLAAYERAIEMDPGYITARHGAGLALLQLGRYEEAIAMFRHALDDAGQPDHPLSLALIAHALARAGREAEAREILLSLERLRAEGRFVAPEYLALVHVGLGDYERAIDALEAARAANSGVVAFLAVEPLVRPLRGHPHFQRLLEETTGRD